MRPEKIRVAAAEAEIPDGYHGATGVIAEVVYVGSSTRFVVDLEAGGRLAAMQQNSETSSMDVFALRGKRIRLLWRRDHEYRVS